MDFVKKLAAFYEEESPEELRLAGNGTQRLEFITACALLERFLPSGGTVLDSCAGTGVYAFHLADKGYKVTAGDLIAANVEKMEQRQRERMQKERLQKEDLDRGQQQAKTPCLERIYHGNALELSRFEDHSFDAVLLMGGLYHLPDEADRLRAVRESLRLLRDGGVLACTYMNRYGVIMNDCAGDMDNLPDVMRFLQTGRDGVFYASTPEEMRQLMETCGAAVLCHASLDGMAILMSETTRLLSAEGSLRWRQYHLATCETPSLLGAGYHNMIIVRLMSS